MVSYQRELKVHKLAEERRSVSAAYMHVMPAKIKSLMPDTDNRAAAAYTWDDSGVSVKKLTWILCP